MNRSREAGRFWNGKFNLATRLSRTLSGSEDMKVVLHNIERQTEDPRTYSVSVSFGDSAPTSYRASFDDSDPRARFCNVEPELFMELSNLSLIHI